MRLLLILAISAFFVLAISHAAPVLHRPIRIVDQFARVEFESFKSKFSKKYASPAEEERRFSIFSDNLQKVREMNQVEKAPVFGVTKFMDLTTDEFAATYLTYKHTAKPDNSRPVLPLYPPQDVPDSFNWVDEGATTPIYNQGECGSCWAFSATEEIESMWFMKHHASNNDTVIRSLSMQQIVDCDKGNGDEGCNGGDTTTAYAYVMKAGGLELFSQYPYAGVDQHCKFTAKDISVSISNWSYVTQDHNETQMQVTSYAEGPLSICVDAASWQFYFGGIIREICGNTLDHCVQITGWGVEDGILGETYYWIIRNSWGASWGEEGFVWVEIGKNLCGVSDEVTIVQAV